MREGESLKVGIREQRQCANCAISLYFMFYNFYKIHKSLRVTPAMEAGISNKLWVISDIGKLIPEEMPKKRGSYTKK